MESLSSVKKTELIKASQYKNTDLYAFHVEIQGLQHSVVGKFLAGRVANFYKENKIRVDTLIGKMKDLRKEYFVMSDEDPEVEKQTVNEKGEPRPVMLEGKTFEEFQEAISKLMNEPATIVF